MASHGQIHQRVSDDDFDFYFGEEIHGVFAAAINFRVAFLAAEPFDFGNGHALDSDGRSGLL